MEEKKDEPSLFLGCLAGYAVATAIGSLIFIGMSIGAGRATGAAGFKLLTATGALGAYIGYELTVRRRKARGISGPQDEWLKFAVSAKSFVIGMIVIGGSFAVAMLIKAIFEVIAGKP